MRVAVSGAHRVGKSTLVAALAEVLDGYEVVDEPYRVMEEDGYEFAEVPTVEDFEAQLRVAITAVKDAGRDVLFDRCPLDVVAYLQALGEDAEVGEVMDGVDLVVVVPIESPDRVVVGADEDRRLRRDVDERVRALVEELDVRFVEVSGSVAERVAQVRRAMRES